MTTLSVLDERILRAQAEVKPLQISALVRCAECVDDIGAWMIGQRLRFRGYPSNLKAVMRDGRCEGFLVDDGYFKVRAKRR